MASRKKKTTKARRRSGVHPLQELRLALRLGRDEFAGQIGRTRPFVAMVEDYDGTDLGRETVLRIFDLYRDTLNQLGITAEDLLRGTRERPAPGEADLGGQGVGAGEAAA